MESMLWAYLMENPGSRAEFEYVEYRAGDKWVVTIIQKTGHKFSGIDITGSRESAIRRALKLVGWLS